MRKVTIIGAGMMTGPIVDYLLDTCNYQVIMADRIVSKAQKIIEMLVWIYFFSKNLLNQLFATAHLSVDLYF